MLFRLLFNNMKPVNPVNPVSFFQIILICQSRIIVEFNSSWILTWEEKFSATFFFKINMHLQKGYTRYFK